MCAGYSRLVDHTTIHCALYQRTDHLSSTSLLQVRSGLLFAGDREIEKAGEKDRNLLPASREDASKGVGVVFVPSVCLPPGRSVGKVELVSLPWVRHRAEEEHEITVLLGEALEGRLDAPIFGVHASALVDGGEEGALGSIVGEVDAFPPMNCTKGREPRRYCSPVQLPHEKLDEGTLKGAAHVLPVSPSFRHGGTPVLPVVP